MRISTVLDHIDSGHMALPEFKRGYVRNSDQVRGLFDWVDRRHPVGGLLVWATESRTAAHRGDGPLAAGVVKLLLDGRQRMTTFANQTESWCSTEAKSFRRYVTVNVSAGGVHA